MSEALTGVSEEKALSIMRRQGITAGRSDYFQSVMNSASGYEVLPVTLKFIITQI